MNSIDIAPIKTVRANVIPIIDRRIRDVMELLQDDWQFLEINPGTEAAETAVRNALSNSQKRSNWAIVEETVNMLSAQLPEKLSLGIAGAASFFKATVTIQIGEHVKTYRICGPGDEVAALSENLALSYLNEYDPAGERGEKLYWSVSASTGGIIDP